uniref:Transcription factor CBF/NF-Y/archaeal histone domain-containing protein n=1 Tax=Panagrolaimus superbus TaxID=310955 RepID=A0A914XXC0_9BILA
MEEERHTSSEERQQQESGESLEAKIKKPRISYIRDVCDLPQTKMRALLKAAFPEFIIEEDALIALTKAAELIVQDLATGGTNQSKNNLVKYEDVADFVRNDRRRAIAVLRDIFPPRKTFADIKKVVLNVKDDEDDD